MSAVTVFVDDDEGYRRWLHEHPGGSVLNCHRLPRASLLTLHRAVCRMISGTANLHWTGMYIKVCALEQAAIEAWALAETGGRLRRCRTCRP